jgi:hypothetical protein
MSSALFIQPYFTKTNSKVITWTYWLLNYISVSGDTRFDRVSNQLIIPLLFIRVQRQKTLHSRENTWPKDDKLSRFLKYEENSELV